MKDNNKCSSGGVGLVSLLLVAFIVLKLCGVIKWSWLWVLAPAWIPVLLALVLLVVAVVLKLIVQGD